MVVDCVEGATRSALTRRRPPVAEAMSDNYGDFKFDKLDENSGRYLVEISAPGHAQARRSRPSSASSINLGEIRL